MYLNVQFLKSSFDIM